MTKLEGPGLERSDRALKNLREHPECHNQGTWIKPHTEGGNFEDRRQAAKETRTTVKATNWHDFYSVGTGLFTWTCGTAQCYAGQIALDLGAVPVQSEEHLGESTATVAYHGHLYMVDHFAAAALDIDPATCTEAFFGGNSIDDIERVTSHWANGRTEFGRTLIHHPSQCLLGCSECEGIRVIQAHIAEVEAAA